jgi:GT2 family glycosyltransferase
VIVLNPDTEIPDRQLPAWLELAKAAAPKLDQPLGLAVPRLINANGREQRSTYKFPSLFSYWLDHSLFGGALKELIKRLPHTAQPARPSSDASSDPLPIDWAMGAAWLVPRRAWTAIGGFDPAYFLYAEDTDFCWRLARAGFQRVLLPDICLIHQQGSPTGSQRGRQQILLFDGLRLYLKRTQRFPTRALVSLAVVLDMGLRLILFGLPALLPGRTGDLYRVRWTAAGMTLWRTLLGR